MDCAAVCQHGAPKASKPREPGSSGEEGQGWQQWPSPGACSVGGLQGLVLQMCQSTEAGAAAAVSASLAVAVSIAAAVATAVAADVAASKGAEPRTLQLALWLVCGLAIFALLL